MHAKARVFVAVVIVMFGVPAGEKLSRVVHEPEMNCLLASWLLAVM